MLTQQELIQLYHRLDLSEPARSMVDRIRASPPVRRVSSSSHSVAGRYPSKKMGSVIQAESHKNELAAIYEFEWDESVLEYYDQPCHIKLTYPAKNGKNVGVMHPLISLSFAPMPLSGWNARPKTSWSPWRRRCQIGM